MTQYGGAIPDKSVMTKDEFADSINPYLNFFNTTSVPELTVLEVNITAKEVIIANLVENALSSSNNAAISAASANSAALRAEAVVIPTTATYSYTQQDWRQSMMSKAEFNAMAAERRANRAGSGADNFGKGSATTALNINEGIYTTTTMPNTFYLGKVSGTGTSLTNAYITSINGSVILAKYLNTTTADATILLPPAPTVLPSTVTLTQQQIDSGVIKHADASNSGLLLNGRNLTDTSGWLNGVGSHAVSSGKLQITNGTSVEGYDSQAIITVIGKKYTIEIINTDGTSLSNSIKVGNSIGASTLVNLSNVATGTRSEVVFTATATLTYVTLGTGTTVTGETALFGEMAVFPADAISRSDLVFLESHHEDVSEKDFVYLLGGVQNQATTGDCGTPVAGATWNGTAWVQLFAGAITYSLFSDTWQADGALVGKGYVWSTLSDANKKAFGANPENNCYLDGATVVQVRYRMRVIVGMGDEWVGYDPQHTVEPYSSLMYKNGQYIQAKGKVVSIANDLISSSSYYQGANATALVSGTILGTGHFALRGDSFGLTYAYEAKAYVIPIATVHRRNQGGYNATYNPNGTKTMIMTPTNIADCFTDANYTATTGYIGTSTSRPDGLFYDQVSVEDFKPANKGADLRNSSKKRTAHQIIQDFAPKVIAGTIPYYNNDTTSLTTYKDEMEVRDTSGNRYPLLSKVGNVATIGVAVANKKGFTVVTQNGKQYLQVADDAASDATVQMNLSTIKYDIGVFDA